MGANALREGISQAALSVCAKHYGKIGAGCGRCPIYAECASECRPGEEGLRAWQARCNAAAESAA